MSLSASDILDSLPHRPPFRFITGDIRFDSTESATACWSVRGDEPFFEGHFPNLPIVPGVLIGEALAQLSGLIVVNRRIQSEANSGSVVDRPRLPALGKLAHIELRFSNSVTPPADIELESSVERVLGDLWQFNAIAHVKGVRVVRGTLTLAIPNAHDARSRPA